MNSEIKNRLRQMTTPELEQSLKTLKRWDDLGYCNYDQLERIKAIEELLNEKR